MQSPSPSRGQVLILAPESTGRIGSVTQKLLKSNGTGGWVEEEVPFNALYDALGQLSSFQAVGTSPVFQWGHTYSYEANGNRTGGTITTNGASMSFVNTMQSGTNRQSKVADITVVSNAAGDISSVLGKTLQYDAAGRLSQATAVPPCPSGNNCVGAQTTISRFNGWGQRYLRENEQEQIVFGYGPQGFELLTQTRRDLASSALRSTEHIWLPTASGPMPIAAVIGGVHYAVHADHLNTPRRLSDSSGQSRWQWPYSGFGEIAPQSTPAAGQAPVNYSLRYPGQIDDGNELFYNWHRFYDPRLGRYISSDPIGLEGGFNRFGYVGGNPLGAVDPEGLQGVTTEDTWCNQNPLVCAELIRPPRSIPIPRTVPREIWWPDRVPGQWNCKARADCNDNIPGNCPEDPGRRFAFGGGTANDLGTARNIAKANATSNLQCQPKHVSCKCTDPKGSQAYSGGC